MSFDEILIKGIFNMKTQYKKGENEQFNQTSSEASNRFSR